MFSRTLLAAALALGLTLSFQPSHAQYGALDPSFVPSPGAEQSGGVNHVLCSHVLPDGRILIGGLFTSYNGVERRGIARLMPDGSLDNSFDPGSGAGGTAVPGVEAMAVLPDGRILVAGDFTSWNGAFAGRIARLNADGSVDPTFTPGGAANAVIKDMVLLPDGKILIAGAFTAFTGTFRSRIARLDPNGALDSTFDPGDGPGGSIRTILNMNVQSNGRIYVTGYFESFAGASRPRVARLMANGGLDATFSPGIGPNATVFSAALQFDGKLIIGGGFTTYGGTPRARLARLNTNGTLDTDFVVGSGSDNVVHAILIREGGILIGGDMLSYNGTTAPQIAGLLPNGSVDPSFVPGTGTNGAGTRTIFGFNEQPDGRILVLGGFFNYDGAVRHGIARILPCSLPSITSINVDPPTACVGDDVTLSVAEGELNGSSSWVWYANGCNGQILGSGNFIVVEAATSTTYHVRGEGGCLGDCVTLIPFVNEPDATVLLSGSELTASLSGAGYQWIDCSNGNEIVGATEQSYTPLSNGSFAVNVTMDGCTSVSECVSVMSVGVRSVDPLSTGWIYPNPAVDHIRIDVPKELVGVAFDVFNSMGQVVLSGRFDGKNTMIDVATLAAGIHTVMPAEGYLVPLRFVKE